MTFLKKIHFHLTANQAVVLGLIGSALVQIFGPGTTGDFGVNSSEIHVNMAAALPLVVGIADTLLHRATGTGPTNPS